MWVFGYGSLIWKVDFPYTEKQVGFIEGYCRRFWQGSEDHRGVPGKPGRVVTLVESDNKKDQVWGIAYKIPKEVEETVLANLDFREKGGYSQVCVTFNPRDCSIKPFELMIYIGGEKNPFYLGPASMECMAEQISQAVGPSGKNSDYLLQLAEAMRRLCPDVVDIHLNELEEAVTKILSKQQLDGNLNYLKSLQ